MLSNGELYTQIMEKLKFEPRLNEDNITISTKENGIIVLSGKVSSYIEKSIAEKKVEEVPGVRGVANELTVDLSVSYKRSDADILKSAIDALSSRMFVPDKDIKIVIENGHLTLDGEVKYQYQKKAAYNAVSSLLGVTYVTNNIQVKSSIRPYEVKNKIKSEFERSARLDAENIQVESNGSEVTLKGHVRSFSEKEDAEDAAWAIPGVSNVFNDLTIW